MSAKHTPGPWFLADWELDDGPNKDVIEAREPEVVAPGSRSIWLGGVRCMQIATVRDSSVDEETTSANARLMAAAPNLLAVLQELEESADYWSEYDVPLGIVDRIRAAIAKATGEPA
jgi:hypothetical protein